MTNPTRACPVLVIDANLIGHKTQSGMEEVNDAGILATIFLSNGIGVLVHTDHPSKRHDAKKESIRRKIEKEINAVTMIMTRMMIAATVLVAL